jgi:hypothetical protein
MKNSRDGKGEDGRVVLTKGLEREQSQDGIWTIRKKRSERLEGERM